MKCAICNQEFKFISPKHLKYKHGIGVAEYRQKYGDIMMQEQKERWISSQKENHWARKPKEETVKLRAKLSENGHKVMTLLKEDGRAHRFTSETAKAIWTEEHRGYMRSVITGLKRSNETRQKIIDNHWTKKTQQEVDDIIERIFLKDAQLKETEKGWYWSEKSMHEMFYMSSYEYRRLLWLENNPDVVWFSTKHFIRIPYGLNGASHVYIPDILVKWKNGEESLEEIKGYIREPEKFEAKKEAANSWALREGKKYSVLFEQDLEASK